MVWGLAFLGPKGQKSSAFSHSAFYPVSACLLYALRADARASEQPVLQKGV